MVRIPTYQQWLRYRAQLPLPHMLLCLACRAPLNWRAYDPAARGKRDKTTREQAANVRVGSICKVKQYEWYIPANGSSEDIVESWHDMLLPFHVAGIGCPDCQYEQTKADADAQREFDALVEDAIIGRRIAAIPFQYDPKTCMRLPTAVSTRTTYRRETAMQTPTKRIAFLDVTIQVLRMPTNPSGEFIHE